MISTRQASHCPRCREQGFSLGGALLQMLLYWTPPGFSSGHLIGARFSDFFYEFLEVTSGFLSKLLSAFLGDEDAIRHVVVPFSVTVVRVS